MIPPHSEARAASVRAKMPATEPIVCIGASTGGTEALREVLEALPATSPAILIVQHMPENFTQAFARRLNGICALEVKEAEDGDLVQAGRVLIAPGNQHMLLQRAGIALYRQYRRRPACVAPPPLGRRAVPLRRADGRPQCAGHHPDRHGRRRRPGPARNAPGRRLTIAQDEESSVVFGMPKEAIQRGAAGKVLPLGRVAGEITTYGRTASQGTTR